MTNEQKKQSLENMLYLEGTGAWAAIAGKHASEKDGVEKARLALIKHADSISEDFRKGAEPYLTGRLSADEKVIRYVAGEVTGPGYMEKIGSLTIEDLYGFYQKHTPKYFEGEKEAKMQYLFNQFKDEKYGDILEKYINAMEILNSKTTNFSEEQKKNAKEAKDKYESIFVALQRLENRRLSSFEGKIEEEDDSKVLEELTKDIKIPEKKE